jgi:hypothetical protein
VATAQQYFADQNGSLKGSNDEAHAALAARQSSVVSMCLSS